MKIYYQSVVLAYIGLIIFLIGVLGVFLSQNIWQIIITSLCSILGLMGILLILKRIQRVEIKSESLVFVYNRYKNPLEWRWNEISEIVEDSILWIPVYHLINGTDQKNHRITLMWFSDIEMIKEIINRSPHAKVDLETLQKIK
jgi:hypothetical protein